MASEAQRERGTKSVAKIPSRLLSFVPLLQYDLDLWGLDRCCDRTEISLNIGAVNFRWRTLVIITGQMLIYAMALSPNVVIDKNEPYWSQNGWRVFAYDAEDMCDIGVSNENDQYMTVGYSAKENVISFMVTNAAATSLVEGQKVNLTVVVLKGEEISRNWDSKQFTVKKSDQKGALFVSLDMDTGLLDALSDGEIIGVMSPQKKAVAGFSLENAKSAIDKLRKCSFEMGELNPDDPFLP
jgi:hypothetical protein